MVFGFEKMAKIPFNDENFLSGFLGRNGPLAPGRCRRGDILGPILIWWMGGLDLISELLWRINGYTDTSDYVPTTAKLC